MAQHALLSPSASSRWLHCTPSARMEAAFPPEESSAALEGTLCHKLAEAMLTCNETLEAEAINEIKEAGFDVIELIGMADEYKTAVVADMGEDSELHVEDHVNLSRIFRDCYGTVDCWFVKGTTLYIYDAKFGRTPVDVVSNSQLIIYALGVYFHLGDTGIDTVSMNIVQPRDGGLKTWTVSIDGLMSHLPSYTAKAELAYMGEGMVAEGPWCTYCMAKALCPAMRRTLGAKARTLKTNAAAGYLRKGFSGVARALDLAPMMRRYIDSVKDFARRHMENGGRIEGYGLKPGNRRTSLTDPAGFLEWAEAKGLDTSSLKTEQVIPLMDIKKKLDAFDYEEAVQSFCTTTQNKSSIIKSK